MILNIIIHIFVNQKYEYYRHDTYITIRKNTEYSTQLTRSSALPHWFLCRETVPVKPLVTSNKIRNIGHHRA